MHIYNAKIIEVYDGDTVTAIIDLGFYTFVRVKLRLQGIKAPEVRGAEKYKGLIVKDILAGLVLNRKVEVKTFKDKKGKFGRYIAILFVDGKNVNEYLLKHDLVSKY